MSTNRTVFVGGRSDPTGRDYCFVCRGQTPLSASTARHSPRRPFQWKIFDYPRLILKIKKIIVDPGKKSTSVIAQPGYKRTGDRWIRFVYVLTCETVGLDTLGIAGHSTASRPLSGKNNRNSKFGVRDATFSNIYITRLNFPVKKKMLSSASSPFAIRSHARTQKRTDKNSRKKPTHKPSPLLDIKNPVFYHATKSRKTRKIKFTFYTSEGPQFIALTYKAMVSIFWHSRFFFNHLLLWII